MSDQSSRERAPSETSSLVYPIFFQLRTAQTTELAEVINYHYQGACLKVRPEAREMLLASRGRAALDFFLGKQCVKRDIPYALQWETIAADGLVGLHFTIPAKTFIKRPERFLTNSDLPPTLSAQDPLDANRLVFCRVVNISVTGMLVSTSLVNKHLFPGMTLKKCSLSFPGQKTLDVEVEIRNTRPAQKKGRFVLGVQLSGDLRQYEKAVRAYVSMLSPYEETDGRLDALSEQNLLGRSIRGGLTYVVVSEPAVYEKVLKLRFQGYQAHGKVAPGATWRDQGDGLDQEGIVVAGLLGGQVVASMELRLGNGPRPLRVLKAAGLTGVPGVDLSKTIEVNKLVVHPKAQGASDVVLGMMQKIHAIVVAKGGFNVLLASTDKLAPFYERLGCERLGIDIPHPALEGVSLRMMIIRAETYLYAKHINPLHWLRIYEATQRHMEGIGVAPKVLLSPWQKLHARATAYYLQRQKSRHKPGSTLPAQATPGVDLGKKAIPPRWTTQHFIVGIMQPYLIEADRLIGSDRVNEILAHLEMPREYFRKQSSWVSLDFFDAFLDEFGQHGDMADLNRRAGQTALDPQVIGVKYYFLKHFLDPETMFRSVAKILPRFNVTRTARLHESLPGHARFSVGLAPGHRLPRHRESCLNFESNFAAAVRIMTGEEGRVKKISCAFDGAQECQYEIDWKLASKRLNGSLVAATGLGILGAAFALASAWLDPHNAMLATAATALVAVGSMTQWQKSKAARYQNALREEFDRVDEEHNDRYGELQTAKTDLDVKYREAKLLEKTATIIQQSNELNRILRVTLDSICEDFQFDRAFVMLVDESKKLLRTAAIAGIRDGLQEVWEFRVDLGKTRDNPLVLSSVYHTGNPVLITNVSAHLFQLNESSRALIRKLSSRGFIMVAIPSETGNWGVMLVDRNATAKPLSGDDVSLLRKVAQHLGIALDKQAKLDKESNLRRLFEKYVPPQVANATQRADQPALGGQLRDVVSLFLDIRGFTALTANHPPQSTVYLLNRVFSMVSGVITSHGGWVDKYLGDGVFATWGALGNSTGDRNQAVKAAMEILSRLGDVNAGLTREGLPGVRVGIGIHAGPTVVGNIGSEERMEFTCIGPTVNLSSRLQELCKVMGSSLVVSSDVLSKLEGGLGAGFSRKESVTVRGVSQPITVGLLDGETGAQVLSLEAKEAYG